MKISTGLLALLIAIVAAGSWSGGAGTALAADLSTYRARTAIVTVPDTVPFLRSERSQSVWASDACWNGCQSHCTANETACFRYDEQGGCLMRTDTCDRTCQHDCRALGGPLFDPAD